MKLYVWNNPYDVRYGGSCLYAVADSEDAARDIAMSALRSHYGYDPGNDDHRLDQRIRKEALGAPTRVRELPYAEVYEWSE
jgi:hypothetical protein